jgi:hypothetical protein
MPGVVSAVDFAAVSDAIDAHHSDGFGNLVDDTVITHANSPVFVRSGQLPATGWAQVPRQSPNRCYHAIVHVCRKSSEVSLGRAFEENAIHNYLPRSSAG